MSATPVDAYASTATAATGRAAARRRWPLLLIGASAGTATWSGWVGLGELTGFGVVHPLPGIWDSLTVNTAITLPIGVEAYAVYALAVATDSRPLTPLARRWAWASAAGALLLGMGGQIAYHLLKAHQVTVAPWWVVALVSSLPVLVLGGASLLWHLAAAPVPAPVLAGSPAAVDAASVTTAMASTPEPLAASTAPDAAATVTVVTVDPANTPVPVTAATDTAAPGPVAVPGAGVDTSGPRALARPAAAAHGSRPTRATASVTGPTDDEILTALAASTGQPPSIRALMRDHGIGQARATRIHRAANHRAKITTTEQHHAQRPTDQTTEEEPETSEQTTTTEDLSKITKTEDQNKINSSPQESQESRSRNHTLASPTE